MYGNQMASSFELSCVNKPNVRENAVVFASGEAQKAQNELIAKRTLVKVSCTRLSKVKQCIGKGKELVALDTVFHRYRGIWTPKGIESVRDIDVIEVEKY